MPLLGNAAVAMWWDMAPAQRAEFEDWHSHEHFPERLSIPGFRRGSRWTSAAGDEGIFVMYELESYETLTSTHYLGRLNDPTPWSVKMMPHHRNMVRSQCRTLASYGRGVARSMLTLRLSPASGRDGALRNRLQEILAGMADLPGITGGHLLQTQTPAAAATKEQQIRGGADRTADWVVLVTGYDAGVIERVKAEQLGPDALMQAGAEAGQIGALYSLSYTLTADDMLRERETRAEHQRERSPTS